MSRRSESTEFLKECMADALILLLQKKPLEKIGVNEIAEAAGVSRVTYFRHFQSKEEVLEYKLTVLWHRFVIEHRLNRADRYNPDNAEAFFIFNEENRELLELLYENQCSRILLNVFIRVFSGTETASGASAGPTGYERVFYEYGLFGILNEWVLNGFREKPEEMAAICLRFTE